MAHLYLLSLQHRSLVEERERHRELQDLLPQDSKPLVVSKLRILIDGCPREPQTLVCEDFKDDIAA